MSRDVAIVFVFVTVAAAGVWLVFSFPFQLMVVTGAAAVSQAGTEKAPAVVVSYWSASIQAETNKDYDEALKQVLAFQRAGGDSFMSSLRSGWLCYLKAAYPEAEQNYANASKLQPTAINPVLGLLTVAQATKDGKKIERAAEAVLKVEPSNYRANMALGGGFLAARDYRRAAFAYRRVLTVYPDDVDARSGAAWALYYAGDKHEALYHFRAILSMYPDYPYAQQGYDLSGGKPAGAAAGAAGKQATAPR